MDELERRIREWLDAERARHRPLMGTPRENRAVRERQLKVLTNRHAWMLAVAKDPILRALIEAHAPLCGDLLFPDCVECPEQAHQTGDSDPESWHCPVWRFISDRMEGP